MHETTPFFFFNQLSETNNACRQTPPTTAEKHGQRGVMLAWKTELQPPFLGPKVQQRGAARDEDGETQRNEHSGIKLGLVLILFPSITFNYGAAPLRTSYFITTERPIVPKAACYISRLWRANDFHLALQPTSFYVLRAAWSRGTRMSVCVWGG